MGSLGTFLRYPDDVYPLLKMKRAIEKAEKQIPPEPHWGFCYSMLHKVSRSFSLVIQQLGTDLRNAVCVFYLVLRALDTVDCHLRYIFLCHAPAANVILLWYYRG
ncbi:hypothetical protein F2Q68_00006463 [Brassica cretica]|uniref:Squalene synthase n=1 Tax=Brassica cretica TaxID=69181 RepID=A0A8S9J3Z9_BRACR|nr:hypothetical protein F2Q68_00006463 [Brassica cretica]